MTRPITRPTPRLRLALLATFTLLGVSMSTGCQHFRPERNATEEPVQLTSDKADYAGSLWLPETPAEGAPVVLFIGGSGPVDRQGNQPGGVNAQPFRLIAQALADAGIASLRFDKIGSGETRPKLASEADFTFADNVAAATGWIDRLRADGRFGRVYVLGHSEGALVAVLAAQEREVAGVLSVSGAGRNVADALVEQLSAQLPEDQLAEARRVIAELRAGRSVPVDSIQLPDPLPAMLFRESVQPYLMSWMRLDPAAEIAKLKTPVLVLQGTTDLQTSMQDAEALATAAGVEVTRAEGVNHVLKQAPAERNANFATYRDASLPVPESVVEPIVGFVLGR